MLPDIKLCVQHIPYAML